MSNSKGANHCIHCGHELPDNASFCPFCETEQTEPAIAKAPPRKGRAIAAAMFAALTVIVIVLVLFLNHLPHTYQGSSKVSYPLGNQTVEVIASFDQSSAEDGHVSPEITTKLAQGDQGAVPLWLCVYSSSDPSAAESFAQEIESITIEAVPSDEEQNSPASVSSAEGNASLSPAAEGNPDPSLTTESDNASVPATENSGDVPASSPMEIYGPDPVDDPSLSALWKADLIYAPENGTNELKWTITMKNQDTILLSQTFTCTPMPVVDLYYQDVPLETVEEIEDAVASVSEDTVLNLYLPPVTYSEPLRLTDRCVNLFGCSGEKQPTTFTAQITVPNRTPTPMSLYGITFSGDGGTAVLAHEGVFVTRCTFTGWDVGVDAVEGSWPIIESSTFEGNQIGFRFNSRTCTISSNGCYDTVFRKNEIAAYLVRVPGDADFTFEECTFEDNGQDVKRE